MEFALWPRLSGWILRAGCLAGCLLSAGTEALVQDPEVPFATGDGTKAEALFWSRERRTWALNLGIVGGIAAYGLSTWNWGETGFRASSEGWFGRGTRHGGADKLGHAFTGAVATAATASLYRHWGYDPGQAARLGAFSGLLLTSAVELGDGFSPDHGFSWEDQVVNIVGVGLEYLRLRHPALRERVQFRWEYFPSPAVRHGRHADLTTDYSGSRYLLAFPLRAWGADDSALQWFEVLVGYGTRGFGEDDRAFFARGTRHPFVGVGLHLPGILDRLGTPRGVRRSFEHLQVPWTALPPPP